MANHLKELRNLENSGKTIVVAVNCSVRYSGRAESFLTDGDRLIIIKSDGTFLIHQPAGNTPVNYMKEGATWSLNLDSDKAIIHVSQQKEFIDITIHKIYSLESWDLKDGQKIQLIGTEKDMSNMIYENPEIVEPGLRPVSTEEQTQYGFIDVFCVDPKGNLVIIECKRYAADLKAVSQLRRYVEKIKESKGVENVRGIICAPKITPNSEKMLTDWGFKFVSVRPPNYHEEFDKKQTSLGDY